MRPAKNFRVGDIEHSCDAAGIAVGGSSCSSEVLYSGHTLVVVSMQMTRSAVEGARQVEVGEGSTGFVWSTLWMRSRLLWGTANAGTSRASNHAMMTSHL